MIHLYIWISDTFIHMDDLSCALNRSNIRGRIVGEIVNHLSYADDLCLICLSSAEMQKLLNVFNLCN